MAFKAKILADSLHPDGVTRLTTMELTYPRIIHSEFMTHRQFSRNAASSRAIPFDKMIANIQDDPFVPIEWGVNQPGMVAGGQHPEPGKCRDVWLSALCAATARARQLHEMGIHKQTVNRIVEPWMWITVIATAVDHGWENFFKLRCAPDAEPHIQRIAYLARQQLDVRSPRHLREGGYHLPLIGFPGDDTLSIAESVAVSVGRCARVSYLTHDGKRDVSADIKMYERLSTNGHWSPFEHVARPFIPSSGLVYEVEATPNSNFGPCWVQHRKEFKNEYCTKAPR